MDLVLIKVPENFRCKQEVKMLKKQKQYSIHHVHLNFPKIQTTSGIFEEKNPFTLYDDLQQQLFQYLFQVSFR